MYLCRHICMLRIYVCVCLLTFLSTLPCLYVNNCQPILSKFSVFVFVCLPHLFCSFALSNCLCTSVCPSILLLCCLPAIDVALIHHSCFDDVSWRTKNCRRKTRT